MISLAGRSRAVPASWARAARCKRWITGGNRSSRLLSCIHVRSCLNGSRSPRPCWPVSSSPAAARLAYQAGLVHDLGRVAVPTGVWERPGALRPQDWELVRLHPYHAGRILARSRVLAPLSQIVSRHHERTDGSGYPAGIPDSGLDPAACLLAVADAFHALGEARPHRPAAGHAEAVRTLSGMPLDRHAVRAVLAAAGDAAYRPAAAAGLASPNGNWTSCSCSRPGARILCACPSWRAASPWPVTPPPSWCRRARSASRVVPRRRHRA